MKMSLDDIKQNTKDFLQTTEYRLANKWRWDGWNTKAFEIDKQALEQILMIIDDAEQRKKQTEEK